MPTAAPPTDVTRPAPTPRADPLAEAQAREAEALRAYRLAVAQADRTWAQGARLLAELDEGIAAVCQRLRQAGYLDG